MNRTKLKTYAPQARRDFIQAVTDRAAFYGLTDKKIEPITENGDVAIIAGRAFPRSIATKRKALEERIAHYGFAQTMDAIAYTWFNRLVAIRYMELHCYLDHGYRVLSHPDASKSIPEILEQAEHVDLPGLDKSKVIELKLEGSKEAELYRMLLFAQCNALHSAMPFLFEWVGDETELLLPDNLLHTNSLIRKLVTDIDEEDWQEVEILGWLYQFYISERKDQVMARKSAVPTEDIPAVTQLFTPHWIVRYLVENSLGRLWLLNRPGSRLREHMPYYIESEAETDFLKITKPEDIRLLDPACGSGHMLTYAFDLLFLIYEEEGYVPNEIPALILKHNLYGLEICPRAAQLAELALVFKAREKSRRFFQPEHIVRPNIIELKEIRFEEGELPAYFKALGIDPSSFIPHTSSFPKLLHQFEEAKNFGSLIQPCLDEAEIQSIRYQIANLKSGIGNDDLFVAETHLKVLRVLEQAEALTQRYHVVVANPPYMGSKGMNGRIRQFVLDNFEDYKSDMFAAFIVRSKELAVDNGYLGFMSPFVWMFISSYEKLRLNLINQSTITSLIHLEYSGFEGATVPICTFTLKNHPAPNFKGSYIRLCDFRGPKLQEPKALEAIQNPACGWFYRASSSLFRKIPGSPIAYWVSERIFEMLESADRLGSIAEARMGLATGDNGRYVRLWYECDKQNIGFSMESRQMAQDSGLRWFPYCKGGAYRKWYGNNEYVVDWEADGKVLQTTMHPSGHRIWAHNFNLATIFKDSLTWSDVTSGYLSVRFNSPGFMFDGSGTCAFFNSEAEKLTALGLLNTTFAREFAKILNPTLHFQTGDFRNVPYKAALGTLRFQDNVTELVGTARTDWDNFETSWDFRDQPLLRPGLKGQALETSWRNWAAQSTAAIRRMQELETENNRLFIAAYGLEGDLKPEVPEEQITLARADRKRDVAAFLSYALGCMMGRYSLDKPGLILADVGDTLARYLTKVGKPMGQLSFTPDEDGIVPVLDREWFADDIVARTEAFLRATFGVATLEANLRFIEESLGKDLLKYFLTDFYKDHLQTYKKRPIYWLFSSGKERAFQCLVYLHRYQEGTLARMRTEYVIPLQGKVAARIEQLASEILKASSTSQRKALEKERDRLLKQQTELRAFDEKLRYYADKRIALDLDDGVKINYGKFGDLLAEVTKVTGGADED